MFTCKARNCYSTYNKDSDISFHKFPLFDSKLLKSWLDNIAPPNYQPEAEDHICSLHFSFDQFITDSEPKRLIRHAIPTINIDCFNNENIDNEMNLTESLKDDLESNNSISSSVISSSDLSSALDDDEDDDSDNDNTYNVSLSKANKKTSKNYKIKKSKFTAPRFVGNFKEEDLQCPKRMKKIWNITQKEINEQRIKIKTLQQRNKRLEGQITRLKNIIRHLKSVHK